MLRFRPLAVVLLVSAGLGAGPAPPSGPIAAENVPAAPVTLTHESLGRVLDARYANELVPSKAETPPRYYTLALNYNPPKSKDNFHWTVTCEIVERGGGAPVARVWFNCQTLPADADVGRLRALLEWSGGHGVSRAFFKTAPHKLGTMLSLVADVPPEDVTAERFPRVLDGLLLMAYETTFLWGGKLSDPLARAATKPPVSATDLIGSWSGKVFKDGPKVGEYAVTFLEGGFATVSRANTTVARPTMQILTGGYSVADGRLTLKMSDVEKPDVFDIALEGKALTLIMKQGESVLMIQLTRSE